MQTRSALSWLSVFASTSTLVCCALPAVLVTLGAGAALSGLVSTVPQIVWLSEHKGAIFGGAAVMLAIAGAVQWRARQTLACPADADLAAACAATKDVSLWVWLASVAILAVGAFFAFVAPLLL